MGSLFFKRNLKRVEDQKSNVMHEFSATCAHDTECYSDRSLGSVSRRECLDAPAILAAFTAGRTGLVACP